MPLSKTDYRHARTCPTKLYYHRMSYPSTLADDAYLQFLADGGYLVEALAKLLYPEGIEITAADPEIAFAETQRWLQQPTITLFGATIVHDHCVARIDILVKRDTQVDLIEVKSKGYHSQELDMFGQRGQLLAQWRETLEDVAFQAWLVQAAYPEFTHTSYLCLPDKAQPAPDHLRFAHFQLTPSAASFARPQVAFTGDVEQARARHFLTLVNVEATVQQLIPQVSTTARDLAASLIPVVHKLSAPLTPACRDCEFRMPTEHSGFAECWGDLANATPHILELYKVGARDFRDKAQQWIEAHRVNVLELAEAELHTAQGELKPDAQRRLVQVRQTQQNAEWQASSLTAELLQHPYPLHFIDFETARPVVPYHVGQRPYEIVAFQWSCHTLRQPDAAWEHTEWLNTRDAFPNLQFLQALRAQIGEGGTLYIWSAYEVNVLKEIRTQLAVWAPTDYALQAWLNTLLDSSPTRFVDLCQLALKSYFHPAMQGSVSLKAVLPALWPLMPELHRHPEFARYYQEVAGRVVNPYQTLPAWQTADADAAETVQEGTAAMRAYQDLLYGSGATDPERHAMWQKLLLQYCELDTAAMVIVWGYWTKFFTK